MSLHFELRKADNGQFSFSLKDKDGKTIVKSEQYVQKANCVKGIESVKKNGQEDARYELKDSSNGKKFFNIKATNGQVVGTSVLFDSEADREKAMKAVKSGVAKAETKEA